VPLPTVRRAITGDTIMRLSTPLAALISVLGVSATLAQNGSSRQGLRIAVAQCAECHRVANERHGSPNPSAPTFRQIAEVPGMTSIALKAALRTSHKTMPNVITGDREADDLIAYILSLRRSGR